jgi:hypothetical protein
MRHLKLVPDLPDVAAGPFDVAVTNMNPRVADITYCDIIHTHFEINGEYPFGVLVLTQETGDQITHECVQGDCVTGDHIEVSV